MNKPYVKMFNENGVLINPINGSLTHEFPNRKQRRAKNPRVMSNKKSFKMIIHNFGNGLIERYRKRIQFINDKQIIHYDLIK